MRLFIAVELPDSPRQHLLAVQKSISAPHAAPSLPPPDKLHLTLKFLGEVPDPAPLIESLHKVRRTGPLVLQAQALKCFPLRGPIRIIGAAIGGDAAGLLGLQRGIQQRCVRLGFPAPNSFFGNPTTPTTVPFATHSGVACGRSL